jgi:tripartite-type tricarboxylate transporter receptor subunit TctC
MSALKRFFIGSWLSVLFVFSMSTDASAETYPGRAINFIIPYPAGGASDIIARILAEKLSAAYSQPVIVQNRPGANGNIATEDVARAKPDGYTILMGNVGPNAINPAVYKNLRFDPVKSFEPVIQVSSVPMVLLVNASLPVKNTQDLLNYIRAQNKPVVFATGGIGSATHLTSAMFEGMGKLKLSHVQYNGDVFTLNDMVGGHITMGMVTLPALLPFLHNDKLRILAVTTARRTQLLPNVPTIAESGLPGFDSSSWGGVFAPAGTPPAIVSSLNQQFLKILALPDVKEKMSRLGIDVVAGSPVEFKGYLAAEVKKWADVVKATGVAAN